MQRIGFACKIQESPNKPLSNHNTTTTTIAWLNRQTQQKAYQRLEALAQQNLLALEAQLQWVSRLPISRRMFRITSDLLPAYTHPDYWQFWQSHDMQTWLSANFSRIGDFAKSNNIRLSFHPGQFCVLASESWEVAERSIEEFEYHADIIRWLGYGQQFQDFKCNVHIGGKLGPAGIKQAVRKLSREARNSLTIENAEFTWGLEHSLELVDTCALVLDIHHHWIMTGEYITDNDPRIKRIIDSWRGQRPVIHYSLSREDVLVDHDADTQPDLKQLKSLGFTSAKLRAHSDFMWNRASNQWAASHTWADIMIEAKEKNLAVDSFIKNQ